MTNNVNDAETEIIVDCNRQEIIVKGWDKNDTYTFDEFIGNDDYISNRDPGDENDESKWIKSQETNAELLMNPTLKVEDIAERLGGKVKEE